MIILCNQEMMEKTTTTEIEHVEIKIEIGVLLHCEATEYLHPRSEHTQNVHDSQSNAIETLIVQSAECASHVWYSCTQTQLQSRAKTSIHILNKLKLYQLPTWSNGIKYMVNEFQLPAFAGKSNP